MAVFPTFSSVPMGEPYAEELIFKTLISEFDDLGAELRKQKWLYPKRNIILKYDKITKAQGRTLWTFYIARSGAYEAFNFFTQLTDTYVSEYVGTGDGTTTDFNLPSKQASSYTVYLNGSAQTGGGVDYTFSSEGGTDGADQIAFTSAPADGSRITVSFTGYLKVRCRFAEDKLAFETFYNRLFTSGLSLKGLLNQ